ncbi:MAG: HAMP domain-containing protein [Ignavibacteria bacterium]|nr:HAMP domain-containing protein [Ignavibacteria bacterium]
MPTITTRLTFWYVGIFGLIIAGVAVAMVATFDRQRRESIDVDLAAYADLLVSGMGGESANIEDVFDELTEAQKKPRAGFKAHRFVVASKDSVVFETNILADTDSLVALLQKRIPSDTASAFTTVVLNELEYRIFAKRVPRKRGSFQLIVITSLDRLYESLHELRSLLLMIVPLSILAAGLGGWFMARRALLPVRNITATAGAISSSSLDRRVPVGHSQDELSELAQTFNAMIERLDVTFKSMQQFIADASHDLRTPLTVVQMELELLLMGQKGDQSTNAALERSLIEVDRLNRLAADLLLLARADAQQLSLHRTAFRVDELLMECAGQLNGLASPRQISFLIDIDQPMEIHADEALLRRAIVNVIDNALKFAPPASSIRIRLLSEESDCCIEISDSGRGIPPEECARVFDRFHRGDTARRTKGTGLGLAIVRAIVEAHHGTVEATSPVGEGATIRFRLPR